MPILNSNYKASHFFKNGHFSTIYSGLIRRVHGVTQERERLFMNDGDFLDLDWSYTEKPTNRLIIILHGLEGNAQRCYMLGTAKFFNANSFDAVCVNFRGCSGEQNSNYKSYHSGATADLQEIIDHILIHKKYDSIVIKGFSLGGNIALKYLGEREEIPKEVKTAVAVSVPCSLNGSCIELHKFKNVLYHNRFKKYLLAKLKQKRIQFPDKVSSKDIMSIKTLKDFDDVYTSKAHGFKDAEDYYKQCSSLQFLDKIEIPTLIINATNDTFLSADCFPEAIAEKNRNLFLEMPAHGGHVGFHEPDNVYYNEKHALKFVREKIL